MAIVVVDATGSETGVLVEAVPLVVLEVAVPSVGLLVVVVEVDVELLVEVVEVLEVEGVVLDVDARLSLLR